MKDAPNHILAVHPNAYEPLPEKEEMFIYLLIDPITEEVRYIGYTIHPLVRLTGHKSHPDGTHYSPKQEWISSLKKLGMKPRLIVIDKVPAQEAPGVEKEWIRYYHNTGADLCNSASGPKRNAQKIKLSSLSEQA